MGVVVVMVIRLLLTRQVDNFWCWLLILIIVMVLVVAIVVVCGDADDGWLFGFIPIIEPQYIIYDYNLLLLLLFFLLHIIYQIQKNNKL